MYFHSSETICILGLIKHVKYIIDNKYSFSLLEKGVANKQREKARMKLGGGIHADSCILDR